METLSQIAEYIVVRLTTDDEVKGLLELFADIADEQSWQPGDYLNSHPTGSIHFALCADGHLVGGLQLVMPDEAGTLPCQHVWPEITIPEASAHVTILGLKAEHRGNVALFWTLCQELWCYCTDRKIKSLVLEATPHMSVLYRRMGLPLYMIGEERVHWGEPCVLAAVDIITAAGSVVLRARRSDVFKQLVYNSLPQSA